VQSAVAPIALTDRIAFHVAPKSKPPQLMQLLQKEEQA
jgi:hypothetical protein